MNARCELIFAYELLNDFMCNVDIFIRNQDEIKIKLYLLDEMLDLEPDLRFLLIIDKNFVNKLKKKNNSIINPFNL